MDKPEKPQALNAEELENVAGGASGDEEPQESELGSVMCEIVPGVIWPKTDKVLKRIPTK